MSVPKTFEPHEIFGDGVTGREYEPIFWLNDDRFKLTPHPDIKSIEVVPIEGSPTKVSIVTRYHRRIYGIGDTVE